MFNAFSADLFWSYFPFLSRSELLLSNFSKSKFVSHFGSFCTCRLQPIPLNPKAEFKRCRQREIENINWDRTFLSVIAHVRKDQRKEARINNFVWDLNRGHSILWVCLPPQSSSVLVGTALQDRFLDSPHKECFNIYVELWQPSFLLTWSSTPIFFILSSFSITLYVPRYMEHFR